jgi:hypothetical protein
VSWISVLKVVAKIAVEYGAVDWAKGWLKKKYDKQYKIYKEFREIVEK